MNASLLTFDKHFPTPFCAGMEVKVANKYERFHAKILTINKDGLLIQLTQDCIHPVGYGMGDVIACKEENIMQIMGF